MQIALQFEFTAPIIHTQNHGGRGILWIERMKTMFGFLLLIRRSYTESRGERMRAERLVSCLCACGESQVCASVLIPNSGNSLW